MMTAPAKDYRSHMLTTTISLFAAQLLLTPSALAQGEARDLALDAFEVEFFRHGVAMSDSDLSKAFSAACEKGYSAACNRVSWLDEQGRPDLQEALNVLLPSCDAGEPVACVVVGWANEAIAAKAREADRDRYVKRADRGYKVHCDGGFAAACHDYARTLYDYPFLGADPRAAVKRWQDACNAGMGPSCTALAKLYTEGGRGVKPSARDAATYAEKGCSLGHPTACAITAEAQSSSWDVAKLDATYGGLCDDGHRSSCWKLARTYFDGIHPEPASGRTQGLFERACELGHARACFEAGRHYGDGARPDDAKAADYYLRACELGAASGCSAQVDMILAERVEGSIKSALPAFELACEERESAPACAMLAYALIEGVDIPRNAERGKELLHRVCRDESSDPRACATLGKVYEEGIGVDRDRTVASKFYRWSCARDEFDSCMSRGDLLVSDVGVRRDDHEALNMYQRACEGGIAAGCRKAGDIVDTATYVKRVLPMAEDFYTRGCDAKDAASCLGLGRIREEGIEGTPDMTGAREAYDLAVQYGSLDAKRRLAKLLWNGYGGRKDKKRARQLSGEACQNGDPVACRGPQFL